MTVVNNRSLGACEPIAPKAEGRFPPLFTTKTQSTINKTKYHYTQLKTKTMKKIFMTFVCLSFLFFGCQDDSFIELENEAPTLSRATEGWKQFKFSSMFTEYVKGTDPQLANGRALTKTELSTFYTRGNSMFTLFPTIHLLCYDWIDINSLKVGIDPTLTGDDDGYYFRKYIHFKNTNVMTEYNIMHELIHAIQHKEYPVSLLNQNIYDAYFEFEAYVICDIMLLSRNHGTLSDYKGLPDMFSYNEYLDPLKEFIETKNFNELKKHLPELLKIWATNRGYLNYDALGFSIIEEVARKFVNPKK